MRIVILMFCILSLGGCGVVKRIIPGRPSPKIVVSLNDMELPESAMAYCPVK